MTTLKRRPFLQIASAGLVNAALTGRSPARAADRRRQFTKDLVPGMIGVQARYPELIDLAHAHGFESIAPDAGYLGGLADGELSDLLDRMKAKNLGFGAAGLPVDFRGDELTFRNGLQELPEFAKALERAGVTRVGTWLRPNSPEYTYLTNFRRHVRRLRQVANILHDHGLRFGLEYVGPKTLWSAARFPFIHTMAETKELINEIGVENVGFVLDSWHWYTAEESGSDLLSLSNHEVVACDLNDAPAGIPVDQQIDNQRELPAATGVIDLQTFLSCLIRIGYDGPVRAEPFNATLNAMPDEAALDATSKALNKAFALVE